MIKKFAKWLLDTAPIDSTKWYDAAFTAPEIVARVLIALGLAKEVA